MILREIYRLNDGVQMLLTALHCHGRVDVAAVPNARTNHVALTAGTGTLRFNLTLSAGAARSPRPTEIPSANIHTASIGRCIIFPT